MKLWVKPAIIIHNIALPFQAVKINPVNRMIDNHEFQIELKSCSSNETIVLLNRIELNFFIFLHWQTFELKIFKYET